MKQKALLSLSLLFIVGFSFAQGSRSDTTKILFIGNSYTYYNSSPELLKGLAKEKFPNQVVETRLISQGGMTLEGHWKVGLAQQAIAENDWDYVVLQEQSKLGMRVIIDDLTYFGQTDVFFEYARKFDSEVKKSGAKTVFFMTWSTKDHPEEQKILTHAYRSIAKALNAKIVPVGLVWDKIRIDDRVNLYARDGSHPSQTGSYLIATTMLASLFGESPEGLSGNISGTRLSSSGLPIAKEVALVNVPKSEAKKIQSTSWKVIKAYQKNGEYLAVNKPEPSYRVPELKDGKPIKQSDVVGKWYGTSTYSNDYYGVILNIQTINNTPAADLSFYTPDRVDRMTVTKFNLAQDRVHLTIMDSLRGLSSDIQLTMVDDELRGVSKSMFRNVTRYKHWGFQGEGIQNGHDLAVADSLLRVRESNREKLGYIDAAKIYYAQYSTLKGEEMLPSEAYLSAMGNILLEDKKVIEGLNHFELATVFYPQSVNAFLNYGVALAGSGQYEKGIKLYTLGYNMAQKSNDKNLSTIEANLKKLKAKAKTQSTPPPPPPPGGGA